MVVLYHTDFSSFVYGLPIVRKSYLFVDFFFVLSGFIMYYNYKSISGAGDFREFIGKRFFRLYPLHLVMLLMFVCWDGMYAVGQMLTDAASSAAPTRDSGFAFVLSLVLANGLGIVPPGFNTPAWSISTEFWTYLLFAAVLMTCRNASRQAVIIAFITISGIALAPILILVRPLHFGSIDVFAFPRCIYGFFLGAALCAISRPENHGSENHSSVVGTMAQCVALISTTVIIAVFGFSACDVLLPLVFAGVIATFTLWPRTLLTRAMTSRPLLWLGKHSYSVYMVHSFVLVVIGTSLRRVLNIRHTGDYFDVAPGTGICLLLLSIALILLVASQAYRLVEQPGQTLGRILLKRTDQHANIAVSPQKIASGD